MTAQKIRLHHTQLSRLNKLTDADGLRPFKRGSVLRHLHFGTTVSDTAKLVGVSTKTVQRVRDSFAENGLERSLYDAERCGRPPKFDARVRQETVSLACTNPPEGAARWTLDLIVERLNSMGVLGDDSISRETVRVFLQEHQLKPWRQEMWCIPTLTEEFVARMEDVLDLYSLPPDPLRPVVCLDEKAVCLTEDARESIPAKPGKPKKIDSEYKRNGQASVFCAVEPKAGRYITWTSLSRSGKDFCAFMQTIERAYPDADKIVLVLDNLSTHTEKSIVKTLGTVRAQKLWDRFEIHYTPVHGSWLNQAEIAIGMLSRQCIGKLRVPEVMTLSASVKAWTARANQKATKIGWKFTKERAREVFHLSERASELI